MQQRLQIHEGWSKILGLGTIGNLLTTISEGNAELARYLEYLYNEKKWRNARNMSSLSHMVDLIAYKRQLPKSSIGYAVVSHTDANSIERLPNFGTSFFELDQASDFDDLVQKTNASYVEQAALVPWISDKKYMVPAGTVFKTTNGISFISTETVESRSLKEPISLIRKNQNKYEDFLLAGGWNGIKYLKIPIIQGEPTMIDFGTAKGTRFESFVIDSINIENASNVISENFFYVEVSPDGNESLVERWEKCVNVRLAGPYDKVFEVKILDSENRVLVKFGDGITGKTLPQGANVKVHYLETLGNAGNVYERFQVSNMSTPTQLIDPRTNQPSSFLQCTNIVSILGGRDIESEDELRVNAPPSYLQSYHIATVNNYLEEILKNSPVNLLHCKIFPSSIYEINSFGLERNNDNFVSNLENSVLQEISMNKNTLLISAVKANGTKIDDPYNELIEPIIKAFVNIKSPSDSFEYIEPNFVEIRPNIIVNTTETLTEDEVISKIMPNILNKYNIFNTTFGQSFYKSDIVDITQNSLVSTYSEIFLEVKANVSYRPIILESVNNENFANARVAFQFNFDKLFSQNKLNPGLKNYKDNNSVVIRADLLFKERPTNNRSLFLFDERTDLQNEKTLIEAELLAIDESMPIPSQSEPITADASSRFSENIVLFNNFEESFNNQQSRTAQFIFIEKIINQSYLYQMKQFSTDPYEIRPLYLDETGKNKLFLTEEVPENERVNLNFELRSEQGLYCYRLNNQFLNDCKLIFYENYEDTNSAQYATGFLIIRINNLLTATEIASLLESYSTSLGPEQIEEDLEFMLKEKFVLNVYGRPREDNFVCEKEYDIIFTSNENCLIQKQYLSSLNKLN